ncbi:putative basic 7S globulin 2 precursor small subunit [Tripterygium wilfordii]|uniref:Putative basic 7S globulin 2 small subunit n=1 Tax=Tripterygium wilfordii TaxID=458696 RepID=A0A7J7E198_TRIWF|nr:probable aspartic proteinase GIP2 [Tripterygium wilfordii]KAF5752378.1 putative basic 7S globulin 2 precursor small subunit [Tripterygium wilfordii]
MASLFQFLLILSSLLSLTTAVVIPVTKHASTLQYVTRIYHGTALMPLKLVVDLGGPFLWLDCSSSSGSCRPIPTRSMQCSRAMAQRLSGTKPRCELLTENRVNRLSSKGELIEDILAFRSKNGSKWSKINDFIFSCAPSVLKMGLASGTGGMLGLGRSPISLPSQLATTFDFQRKFAVCLSASDGAILLGDWDSAIDPKISRSLMYTPLVNADRFGKSHDYFIYVKSVKINGERLSIGAGEAKISSVVPYATMESSVYASFVNAYLEAATNYVNMTRVASVAPFEVCFSSEGVSRGPHGPTVPVIDLVLQSEMVKWRIYGRNSMVAVNDEVICLGFLDGGLKPTSSIVIGGFQLEDNLVEFDLGISMLGFSSSLQPCSDLVRDTDSSLKKSTR